ncbi:trypsin-like peptidase domain-containing protein [Patescibacteria group bacterium]|nr:trypsin-like peptidase domain-containing protein [Patescibacteria group bacterium]MBU4022791.1 trypsin-like peptidase domain-containing protein [Patescibacteria group bacterium]MBU4078283.1 trypsin-like peptidase domain-containing protein [Patescibacteria group bacterium]
MDYKIFKKFDNNIEKIQEIIDNGFGFKNVKKEKFSKNPPVFIFAVLLVLSAIIGGAMGALVINIYWQERVEHLLQGQGLLTINQDIIANNNYIPQTTEEQKTIQAVKDTSPAVVSIVITKDIPILEKYYIDPFGNNPWGFGGDILIPQYRQKGTEKRQVGGGTGFIISKDGMIITNKHVLSEEDADYTVFLNNGESYPVEILAKDPFYDLAVIRIDQTGAEQTRESFPIVKLGDSSKLQIGQTVIAIGYALGEFENTVSTGVVSGLGRNITAVSQTTGFVESLEGIIQTDAAINPGNSGGPLLNLLGEVIGINVARSETGENIGFSLPINMAKRDIEQVKVEGRIVYPYLGVYYTVISKEISQANDLSVDYGAWVGRASDGTKTEIAIIPGTSAEIAGLERDDIILEWDGEKITTQHSLAKFILRKKPGDSVQLKILRNENEFFIDVILGEKED